MRVITGTARGRNLKTLDGLETRPTADKIKQAVFNTIQFDIEGMHVLDLFAGSGQMGIEALSRGAKSCVFADSNPDAVKIVEENLSLTKLAQKANVYNMDAFALLKSGRLKNKIGIAFLDPPYAGETLLDALNMLISLDIMADFGVIIAESSAEKELPEQIGEFFKCKKNNYGKTSVSYYRKGENV